MELIAAVDKGLGIGFEGSLLFKIPGDLEAFYRRTAGQCILYGRRTIWTFPDGRPLQGRTNIILSRKYNFKGDRVFTERVLGAALERAVAAERVGLKVYVVGGENIFRKVYRYCTAAYITEVNAYCPADKFFPAEVLKWDEVRTTKWTQDKDTGLEYRYRTFRNPRADVARRDLIRHLKMTAR